VDGREHERRTGIFRQRDLGVAADVLEMCSEEILADYERRLLEARSPLVADLRARHQLRAQARRVLTDVAGSLRGTDGTPEEGPPALLPRPAPAPAEKADPLSASIGAARASEGVHASESLRAVAVLSEAALSAVVDGLPPSGSSRREVAAVALAIQQSIMERVSRASLAYVGYLLRKVHESHADERRRIGRELHDRVAHSIVVVFRNLELHDLYEARDPDKAREKLELAKLTAQEALKGARELSSELRHLPAEGGLEVALSDHLRSVAPAGVEAWVSVAGDENLIPPEVRGEAFLILREAVGNALAHSSAKTLEISIAIASGRLRASVEDDGRGFDPTEAAAHGTGTGLSSMRESALLLGGTLTLSARPGEGTRVELSVPLPRLTS
jgi:signal transduction histidine kinase